MTARSDGNEGSARATAACRALGRRLAALFLLFGLPASLFLAVTTPPGQVADEPGHVIRAASVAGGQLLPPHREVPLPDGSSQTMPVVFTDPALREVAFVLPPGPGQLDREKLDRLWAIPWRGPDLVPAQFVGTYLPAFYVPGGAGIALARALGRGPYETFLAGRIASALVFAVLAVAALLAARRAHALFFCTLSFPMTLSLAGSYNQDGPMIGATVLAAALVTRFADAEPGEDRRAERWGAAALLAAVAGVKITYLPLAALLLLPLSSWPAERRGWIERLAPLALVAVVVFGWWWLSASAAASSYVQRAEYEAGPHWPGPRPAVFDSTDPVAQASVLRARPSLALRLTWLSLVEMRLPLAWGMVGILGWLHVLLPQALYRLWFAAVAAATAADVLAPAAPRRGRWLEAGLLGAAVAAAVVLVHVACYVVWTDVGLDRIHGPQGRYFLPLVPVAAVALPALRLPGAAAIRTALGSLPVLAAAAGLVVLPAVVFAAFYVR